MKRSGEVVARLIFFCFSAMAEVGGFGYGEVGQNL
jgi:hypothetical protein